MRVREKQVTFWVTYDEYYKLRKRAEKVGLSVSELLRELANRFEPREKPPERFYDAIKQMRALNNNMNQLARRANATGIVDEIEYKKYAEQVSQCIVDMKKEFLLPKEVPENLEEL